MRRLLPESALRSISASMISEAGWNFVTFGRRFPILSGGYTLISTTIYGLEILSILATLFPRRGISKRENATSYIDNSNCMDALVRGYAKTAVINRMAKLRWPKVQKLGISARFGIIHSDFNPADAPTREAAPLSPPGGNLSLGF